MKYSHFIGVDISKSKLDISVYDGKQTLAQEICKNDNLSIKKTLKNLEKKGIILSDSLICAEHTGMYSFSLIQAAKSLNVPLWLDNPAEIKLRSGVQRGKNDKVDSERIALYAYRYQDVASPYESNDEIIEEMKYLLSERELLVVDKAKYLGQIKDQKGHMPTTYYNNKVKRFKQLIKSLEKGIGSIEIQLDTLLKIDKVLKRQYDLITSVLGVGKQVAIQTLVSTRGFKSFTDARKFACHVGVAPFSYMSGSSQRSKRRVSHRANKKLKQLFHMAALSAVQVQGEMRDYFLRKVADGKNKMTVINAIRSKIIHRIFAVIKNNKKYDRNYENKLVLSIR
jgi:transposase